MGYSAGGNPHIVPNPGERPLSAKPARAPDERRPIDDIGLRWSAKGPTGSKSDILHIGNSEGSVGGESTGASDSIPIPSLMERRRHCPAEPPGLAIKPGRNCLGHAGTQITSPPFRRSVRRCLQTIESKIPSSAPAALISQR